MKKLIYLFVILAIFASCKSNSSQNSGEFGDSDTAAIDSAMEIDKATMENMIQNVSSPVEMAALIKSLGVPYSQKYLAPTQTNTFNTNNAKAFNLGIYGADLGYMNMYNKTSLVVQYISSIKELADGINIGQFFDFTTLKRLATNNENIDSLMFISVHSFVVMDDYLRKNKRSNLSALMVAGVYVESLYLLTQVAKDKPNTKLAEAIGDQKTSFKELMIILNNYKKDPYFANLIAELSKLQKEFEPITITITPGEPVQVVKNGMLTIEQKDVTNISISDAVLKNIISITESTRNKLIK
jgi:hypothetical protein